MTRNYIRRITSVVLAVISILTIAVPAFAQEAAPADTQQVYISEDTLTDNYSYDNSAEITESVIEENAKTLPVDSAETSDSAETGNDSLISDTYVAIMYLCVSGPHAPYIFGHTWICIRNISEETISIGSRSVDPGEMASFGLHHFDGMHYDDEMNDYRGETVSAREYRLTGSDLDTAEREITNSRWGWYEYFAHNCTNFATSVWNKVTGQHYFAFCFPFVVQIQMAINGLKNIVMSSR